MLVAAHIGFGPVYKDSHLCCVVFYILILFIYFSDSILMTASGLDHLMTVLPHLPIMTNSSQLSRRVSLCWYFLSCWYFIVDLLPWKENEVGKCGILPCAVFLDLGQDCGSLSGFVVVGGRWLKSFCLCLWWLISDFRGVTIPIAQDPRLDLWPVDHDVDRETSRYDLSSGQLWNTDFGSSLRSYQVILDVNVALLYVTVVLILLSETGRDEPSVLQLNVRPSYSMCCNWITSAFASWQNKL